MKTCFKCGSDKPLTEFYRHPQTADGHLNKCKECTKRDTRANRSARLDYYQVYDRKRYDASPERRAIAAACAKARSYDAQRYAKKYPERKQANTAVANAIRNGKLIRKPCEVCGATVDVEAHHDDYSKPLDVRWLCVKHHAETRKKPRHL